MIEKTMEISCDVCQDLIPLVQDQIASEDSCRLVNNHIEECESCRAVYSDTGKSEINQIIDQKSTRIIKRRIFLFELFILILGAFLGVYLSNTSNIFYNIFIMPFIGMFGYFVLGKRWYYVPISIFLLSYIWSFITNLLNSKEFVVDMFMYPVVFSLIYTILTLIGLVTGILLTYAFQKDKKY